MKKCTKIEQLLSIYIDNETTLDETKLIEEHILVCSNCKKELTDLRTLKNFVNKLPEENLPDNYSVNLHQKLLDSTKPKKTNFIINLMNNKSFYAGFSSSAAIFIIGFVLFNFNTSLMPNTFNIFQQSSNDLNTNDDILRNSSSTNNSPEIGILENNTLNSNDSANISGSKNNTYVEKTDEEMLILSQIPDSNLKESKGNGETIIPRVQNSELESSSNYTTFENNNAPFGSSSVPTEDFDENPSKVISKLDDPLKTTDSENNINNENDNPDLNSKIISDKKDRDNIESVTTPPFNNSILAESGDVSVAPSIKSNNFSELNTNFPNFIINIYTVNFDHTHENIISILNNTLQDNELKVLSYDTTDSIHNWSLNITLHAYKELIYSISTLKDIKFESHSQIPLSEDSETINININLFKQK